MEHKDCQDNQIFLNLSLDGHDFFNDVVIAIHKKENQSLTELKDM